MSKYINMIIIVWVILQKKNLLSISIIITDTRSTITLLDRASFQLQNTILEACLTWQLSLKGMKSVTQIQILNKAVCVSLCVTTLEKSMNPSILPRAIGK